MLDRLADAPLYQPYIFKFSGVPPNDMFQLMQANPYGVFKFTYRGVVLYGFPLNVGFKPGRTASYTFELLSSPDNDLSTLVY